MFYQFRQNNSGGRFTQPAINLIIEAHTAEQANSIAEYEGAYFDGCDMGRDCSCCGDRWYRVSDDGYDSKHVPSIYDTPVEKALEDRNLKYSREWAKIDGTDFAKVVYLDGSVAVY